jgi:hypothetical protein
LRETRSNEKSKPPSLVNYGLFRFCRHTHTARSGLVFLARLTAGLVLRVALPRRLLDRFLAPRRRISVLTLGVAAFRLVLSASFAARVREIWVVTIGTLTGLAIVRTAVAVLALWTQHKRSRGVQLKSIMAYS